MDLFLIAWFPGVLLGGYCMVYGITIGILAAKRRARHLAYGLHYGMVGLCSVFLASGVVLWVADQERAVWEAYGIAGLIGLMVALGMGVALKALYK